MIDLFVYLHQSHSKICSKGIFVVTKVLVLLPLTTPQIEKDLDRILESCQQQPSRLPSDQKKV